jgi:outer membrane biosynthesis protein TonB
VEKNEDGEFELILGNRQLLSVFFIVVILLGVFFTVGYIVGRNSAPVMSPEVASAQKTQAPPLVVESAAPRVETPSKETAPEPPKAAPPPAETKAQQPTGTAPQQPAGAASQKAPEPPKQEAKAEPPKPTPAKTEPPKALPPSPVKPIPGATTAASGAQPSGTFLQLAATSQREADIMVDVLRKANFRAMAAAVPEKAGLFRVLVGPMTDADVNKMRTDLQNAGFPGNAALRRTF